jgi:hypothetical protein
MKEINNMNITLSDGRKLDKSLFIKNDEDGKYYHIDDNTIYKIIQIINIEVFPGIQADSIDVQNASFFELNFNYYIFEEWMDKIDISNIMDYINDNAVFNELINSLQSIHIGLSFQHFCVYSSLYNDLIKKEYINFNTYNSKKLYLSLRFSLTPWRLWSPEPDKIYRI